MAFSLNVGSVTNILRQAFPMSLKSADTKNLLPCAILNITEIETNQIPTAPQDSNIQVADTIFKLPKKISCEVFVYSYEIEDFEAMLEGTQAGKKGFNLNGVYKSYFNIRLAEKIIVDTPEMTGGTTYNLTFDEVIFVDSTTGKFGADAVEGAENATTKNTGSTQGQETSQSLLKKAWGR